MRSFPAALLTCALLASAAFADDPRPKLPKGDDPKPAPKKPVEPKKPEPKKPEAKKPGKPGWMPFDFPKRAPGEGKSDEDLILDLDSKDAKTRASAATALGNRNVEEALPKLIERFHDADLKVRLAAIQSLVGIAKSDHVLPKVVALLGDKVEQVRLAAGFVLQKRGPKKTMTLLGAALGSKDRNVRFMTLQVLRRYEAAGKDAAPGVQVLLSDSDEEVRLEAARTLGAFRSKGAAKALVHGLTHKTDAKLRKVAALELRWFKDLGEPAVGGLRGVLKDRDWQAAQAAARALGGIGPKAKAAIPDLVVMLGHKIYNLREAAILALAGIGKASVPALTAALGSDTRKVKKGAAQALGRIGSDSYPAVPKLMQGLADDHHQVRRACADALGYIGAKADAAVDALRKIEEEDDDRRVRRAARQALKRVLASH